MPRNAEVIRQWTILRKMEASRGATIRQLAESTGVTTRTIRRDLEALQEAGFPLYDEPGDAAKRWRLDTRPFRRLDETGLQDVVDTGIALDAAPTAELLEGIFQPGGPLHDGAVVISRGRVVAASCMLPTAINQQAVDPHLGTRHRAALGISEQTDAVVVVVSEENGQISIAADGKLLRPLDRRRLENNLAALLHGGNGRVRRNEASLARP